MKERKNLSFPLDHTRCMISDKRGRFFFFSSFDATLDFIVRRNVANFVNGRVNTRCTRRGVRCVKYRLFNVSSDFHVTFRNFDFSWSYCHYQSDRRLLFAFVKETFKYFIVVASPLRMQTMKFRVLPLFLRETVY